MIFFLLIALLISLGFCIAEAVCEKDFPWDTIQPLALLALVAVYYLLSV